MQPLFQSFNYDSPAAGSLRGTCCAFAPVWTHSFNKRLLYYNACSYTSNSPQVCFCVHLEWVMSSRRQGPELPVLLSTRGKVFHNTEEFDRWSEQKWEVLKTKHITGLDMSWDTVHSRTPLVKSLIIHCNWSTSLIFWLNLRDQAVKFSLIFVFSSSYFWLSASLVRLFNLFFNFFWSTSHAELFRAQWVICISNAVNSLKFDMYPALCKYSLNLLSLLGAMLLMEYIFLDKLSARIACVKSKGAFRGQPKHIWSWLWKTLPLTDI